MAVVSIVVGCFIGLMAGVFSVAFLGVSLWEGFVIYLQASVVLSLAIGLYVTAGHTLLRPKDTAVFDVERESGPPVEAPIDPQTQAQIDSFNAQMNAPLPDLPAEDDGEDRKSA